MHTLGKYIQVQVFLMQVGTFTGAGLPLSQSVDSQGLKSQELNMTPGHWSNV